MYPTTPESGAVTQAPAAAVKLGKLPSRFKALGLAVGAVLLVALTAAVTLLISRNSLSDWDVLAAGSAAASLSSDVSTINTSIKALETATNKTDLDQASATASDKLTDAQKQYSLIQKSPVLQDNRAGKSFTSLKAAWGKYTSFVDATLTDYKTLGPTLIDLSNAQQDVLAATTQASGSNVDAQLMHYRTALTTAYRQVTTQKMKTVPDQQLVDALKTYLNTSDTVIARTQDDLASHKSATVITADFTSLATAATLFSDTQVSLTTPEPNQLKQLDPTKQLGDLTSALKTLSERK